MKMGIINMIKRKKKKKKQIMNILKIHIVTVMKTNNEQNVNTLFDDLSFENEIEFLFYENLSYMNHA